MNEGSQALVALFAVVMTSLAGVITALGVRNKKWQEGNEKYTAQLEKRVTICESKWAELEAHRAEYDQQIDDRDRRINRLLREIDDLETKKGIN